MADVLTLVKQLKDTSGNLRSAADNVAKTDITKEFADTLEEVITNLQSVSSDLCASSSAFVQDFDIFLTGSVKTFIDLSNQIGGEVQEQVALVEKAFQVQRAFVAMAAECKPPPDSVLVQLLKPTSDLLTSVQEYREKRRGSQVFNHLSAVSEGIPVLGWVTIKPKPCPYIKDTEASATFYTNRVVKDYKGKDEKHVEWTRALIKLMRELEAYVKQHHVTGLSWNKQGKDAVVPTGSAAAAPPPPPGGAPAPPPPPPVEAPSGPAASGDEGDEKRAALFADLNKGADVTKGLKKVTDDMKTHKNPDLRKQAKPVSSTGSTPKPYKAPTAQSVKPATKQVTKKPPRKELTNKKWDIEYFENDNSIILDDVNMKQVVYIYKCTNSTIQIKGKVNSITMDGCKKVGLVFDSVLSSVDMVNCQSVKVQITGMCRIVNIDKTDGCEVYVSEESKDVEIISAKSSEMNLLVPVPGSDGDLKEYPLPEQYKTTYDSAKGKIITVCQDSLG